VHHSKECRQKCECAMLRSSIQAKKCQATRPYARRLFGLWNMSRENSIKRSAAR